MTATQRLQARDRIKAALLELASCYPRFGLTDKTLNAYASHLERIPPTTIENTLHRLAETSDFFPSIAQIIRLAEPPDERTNLQPVYTAADLERMIHTGATEVVRGELLANNNLTEDDREHLEALLDLAT